MDSAGTGSSARHSSELGTPNLEADGLFTTNATAPGTDVAMMGVIAEGVTRSITIPAGEALTGAYFQPRKNDRVMFLDGPDLHPAGSGTADMVFKIQSVESVSLGGGIRLGLVAAHGAKDGLGGGTPSD